MVTEDAIFFQYFSRTISRNNFLSAFSIVYYYCSKVGDIELVQKIVILAPFYDISAVAKYAL